MNNGRATGIDGIPIELFKISQIAKEQLYKIICRVWEEEKIPHDMTTGCIINIHKKGDHEDMNNYRHIALLPRGFKVLTKIINARLLEEISNLLPDSQAGFRVGRGCRDHIFSLKVAIHQFLSKRQHAFITFIDFKAAFGSIDHNFMLRTLLDMNVSTKLSRLITVIYRQIQMVVKDRRGSLSRAVSIHRGIIEGDRMSPLLFIASLPVILS